MNDIFTDEGLALLREETAYYQAIDLIDPNASGKIALLESAFSIIPTTNR